MINLSKGLIPAFLLLLCFHNSYIWAQTNNFPLYSSGAATGGNGDYTNITNPQLKLQATTNYLRLAHLSAHPSISTVYNYETNKDIYWGEPGDGGNYFFRGRNFIVNTGVVYIGTTDGLPGSPYSSSTLLKVFQPFNTTLTSASIDIGLSQPHGRITGIGNSADNSLGQMAFSTLRHGVNTEAMRIDVDGNIGIGTTTPGNRLEIQTVNTLDGLKVSTSGGTFIRIHPNNLTSTAYNGITVAGDAGLIFGGPFSNNVNFGFVIAPWASAMSGVRIDKNGNVGINTNDTKTYQLAVNGSAIFTKAVVKLYANWPDYVFHKDYHLPSLDSLSSYLKANNHLPEMPSADSVMKNGLDLGATQALMLKKIEELTLYIIAQDRTIRQRDREAEEKERAFKILEDRIMRLERSMK